MILLYHKVYPETPTGWWVYVDEFYRQMSELKNRKVVCLDEYDPEDEEQVVITFDGVYSNVLKYAAPVLKYFNYPFELFVVGDFIGKDNSFENDEPLTDFANINELKDLVKLGGRLQWHSRSHIDLKGIAEIKVIERELEIPAKLKALDRKGFKWFGYSHGEYNKIVLDLVKNKFDGALSVVQGDNNDRYKLNRSIVNSETELRDETIGVVIPSYNYGHFLIEAVESVLRQTVKPDKILISDDYSTDNTEEIGRFYQSKYPNLISFNRNNKNLGIVPHFRKAVSMIDTDYICFLGADNRFRSDYIEKCAEVLDSDEKIGIAYTDLAVFGERAAEVYAEAPKNWKGEIKDGFKIINYPEYNDKTKSTVLKRNFMHGSSMYKKEAYKKAGGYKEINKRPEDHSLFVRILKKGYEAKRVPEPVLEYRQHSLDQANTSLGLQAQLVLLKNEVSMLKGMVYELEVIKASKFWKLLNLYKNPKTAVPLYTKKLVEKIKNKLAKL